MLVPTVLLIVSVVYCQMHYGIDALAGVAVGSMTWWLGGKYRD
jgi:membrane-associated phospholipid phosphatase